MGYQLVGPKKLRRFSVLGGLPLAKVYGGGSYMVWFPAEAVDGRHLWINARTGEVEFLAEGVPWGANPDQLRRRIERQAWADELVIERFGSLDEAAHVANEYREGART